MGVKRIFVYLVFFVFSIIPQSHGLQKENGHVNWYVGTEGNGISIFPSSFSRDFLPMLARVTCIEFEHRDFKHCAKANLYVKHLTYAI